MRFFAWIKSWFFPKREKHSECIQPSKPWPPRPKSVETTKGN